MLKFIDFYTNIISRQVGKTYSILEFGRTNYENVVYFNFETNPKLNEIKKPLENYRDIDAFKIYVSDLGLLCAKKDLAANDILYMVVPFIQRRFRKNQWIFLENVLGL